MSTIRKIPINAHGPGGPEPLTPAAGADTGAQADMDEAADRVATAASSANTDPGATGPGPVAATAPDPTPLGGTSAALATEASTGADSVEKLTGERDALNDALLRLRAEFENYRRRSVRELAESRQWAQAELLNDLLPILDNLERALDAAEHHEENKVLGGVRMTRDMFVDQLKRTGVEEIETVGVPFDPAVHEAIAMQPSEYDEGVVAAVLQRGYRQGDRVLRPARVVVSSGLDEADDGATNG